MAARLQAALADVVVVVARQCDRGAWWHAVGAKSIECIEAVTVGKSEVEQHYLWLPFRSDADDVAHTAGNPHVVASFLEQETKRRRDELAVFSYEKACGWHLEL